MSTPAAPVSSPIDSPIDAAIDELWERRDGLSPADEDARKIVVAAVDQLDAGEARVACVDPATQRGRRRRAGQAGDPAVVQGAGDGGVLGRRLPVPRPDAAEDPLRRRTGGARRDRALGLLHGARRRAHAELRQHRRLRRRRIDGRHLGDRRVVRPGRGAGAPVRRRRARRRARAAERDPGRHRGRRLHRIAQHRRRRRPGPPRREARRRLHPDRQHPGLRRDAAATSCRAARCRSGPSSSARARSARSPAASSPCRACWCCARWPRARSTTSWPSTTSCASTASRRDGSSTCAPIRCELTASARRHAERERFGRAAG